MEVLVQMESGIAEGKFLISSNIQLFLDQYISKMKYLLNGLHCFLFADVAHKMEWKHSGIMKKYHRNLQPLEH